jgi:hypothetical protein
MAHTIGNNCKASKSTTNNPTLIQRFFGVLNDNGELNVTGTNLLSLTPSVIYTSLPKDINCSLYVEVVSDQQAIVKNTGQELNAGVSVKGKFE